MTVLFGIIKTAGQLIRRGLFFLPVAVLLQASTLPLGTPWYAVAHLVSPYQFDYLGWELGALAIKTGATLWGVHPYLDEAARSGLVRAYFADLGAAQQIEQQIDALYSDPTVTDPGAVSAELRAERDTRRADLNSRQALVEAILEGQVAAVLVDEGFGTGGQLLPPIAMHFSRVPHLVVVSPRTTIRMDIAINVVPLPVDTLDDLERQIEASQDGSALIVPLGGIGLYPAMVLETSYLPWAIETFAHEWVHHYLYFYPLGYTYTFAGEARIINETVADYFGKEVVRLVLARYYPDLLAGLPPFPPVLEPVPDATLPPTVPLPFDFAREMHTTRTRVDALLAAGEIDAAEQYMRERRAYFAANGYPIRKLNQAYFAFYGGYQGGAVPGIGGEDPIGPAVHDLRAASPSLHEFIVTVRSVTTREALLATLAAGPGVADPAQK